MLLYNQHNMHSCYTHNPETPKYHLENPLSQKTVRTQHVICRLSRCQDGDLGLTVTLSRSMSRQAQADFNQQAHL